MRSLDKGTLLSTLWLFILLNIIFRDLHQFARQDVLQMLLDGHYFGLVLTEELALLGGFLSLVPIGMVLFSPSALPAASDLRCGGDPELHHVLQPALRSR